MFAALGALALASISNAPIVVDGELCHPQNLLVKYTDQASLAQLKRATTVIRTIPQVGYAVIKAPLGRLQLTRNRLQAWPNLARVDLDRCALPAYDPNDEYWPNQWDMRAIRANYAWDTQKGDPSVIVAVIDTGVKVDHPDLAPNIWVNTGEIPGNGIDDDGDGYIDDVNGYDFSHNDGDPNDVYGHGTACAGLVAAVQDDTIGVSGVAPHCRIMALKASTDDGYFYDSNDLAAYIYAADHGAKVLSMSYFSDRVTQAERDGIDYCWAHGVLPVAAAGNAASIFPFYPAAYEHVLSVAAVDGNLNKAGFSNYGSWVSVSAPGTGLYTTTNDGGYTSGFGGTSGACPHVAGVAALCFSMSPNATNAAVRAAIEDTATIQNQAPYGEFTNYGLVNAEMAVLRMVGGGAAPHPPLVRYFSRFASIPLALNSGEKGYLRGRGFEQGIQLFHNGQPVPALSSGRNSIVIPPSLVAGNLEVRSGGVTIANYVFPSVSYQANPLVEASTQGANLTGAFNESLNADGQVMTVTRRSDGYIVLQGTFKMVPRASTMKLTLRRRYTNTTVGTETVQLYDWSSASYPYGNFVTVGGGAVPTAFTNNTYTISDAQRFVDPEGTVYLLITTSSDLPSGAELELDMAYLE